MLAPHAHTNSTSTESSLSPGTFSGSRENEGIGRNS